MSPDSSRQTKRCFLSPLFKSLCPLRVPPPDLAAVVAAWSDLPEAIKAGILAMVKAASLER
ncbi:MAG: hypothetical protein WBX00_08980 [Isosphaeraceae bacterium]